ncbi:MAG: hypothetical protein QME70_07965 [Bacillota bacterium]|nr:hypothetical protein [Bacillota bacterium]
MGFLARGTRATVCLAFLAVLLAGCWWLREQAAEARPQAGELASRVAELEAQLRSLREELAAECLGLVPDDVNLKEYADQLERSDDELLEYSVHGYEMMGRENAAVYVSYRARYRSSGQVSSCKREPWSCIKENGVWKVRWLPWQ